MNTKSLAERLVAALEGEGLRGAVHRAYDLGQTAACDVMQDVEGLDEERFEHLAHVQGIGAIVLYLRALRAAGGVFRDRNAAGVVDNLLASSLDEGRRFRAVDDAFTLLG